MGEGMSQQITKGLVNRKVDLMLNEKDGAGKFHKRATFLAAIKNAANATAYFQALRDHAGVTLEETNYLRDTWYNEGREGFWSWLQPVYQILVRGLIKTVEEAGTDLPVDTYWSPASDQLVVVVAKSTQQVTRLILTPPVHPARAPKTRDMPLWIVRRGSAQEVVGRQTFDGIVEAVNGNVSTWKVRDV